MNHSRSSSQSSYESSCDDKSFDENVVSPAPPHEGKTNELRLMKRCLDHVLEATHKYDFLREPLNQDHPNGSMGLTHIQNNFGAYDELRDFTADIDRLVRAYLLKYGDREKYRAQRQIINGLSERCHRDAKGIEKCGECIGYWLEDKKGSFVRACDPPHLILYAQLESYPYWPAKLMAINGDYANVEFFDDHSQADIPLKKCLLYCEKYPGKKSDVKAVKDAQKEVKEHFANVTEKFGAIYPAKKKILLCATTWKSQLKEMIPGAFGEESPHLSDSDSDDGKSPSFATARNLSPTSPAHTLTSENAPEPTPKSLPTEVTIEPNFKPSIESTPIIETAVDMDDGSALVVAEEFTVSFTDDFMTNMPSLESSSDVPVSQNRIESTRKRSASPEELSEGGDGDEVEVGGGKRAAIETNAVVIVSSDAEETQTPLTFLERENATLRRRIIMLENEKRTLETENESYRVEKQLNFSDIPLCADCGRGAEGPYFCDDICKESYNRKLDIISN